MTMDGKTVLITGSTDGVGRYVAATLAASGAKVLIHGRDGARAKGLIAEINRAGGGAPIFHQADLSSLTEVRRLAEAVIADHTRLDVFVSNAGIGSRTEARRGKPARTVTNCASPSIISPAFCSRIC